MEKNTKNAFTMTQLQFAEAFTTALQKNLPEGFTVDCGQKVTKENDVTLTAINIKKEGCSGGCVTYVEPLYDRYCRGEAVEIMAKEFASEVSKSEIYSLDTNKFGREDILEHTTYRMANKVTNQLRLSDVPTRDVPGMSDIVIYPTYEVSVGARFGTVMVTNQLLESNGISVAEIHAAAEANTERRMTIIPLENRICGMISGDEEIASKCVNSPFLVSYDKEARGDEASILGAPKVLARLLDKVLEGEFYIIPSSTHELLFLPKSFEADLNRLLELVEEVNSQVLDPKEILSYNVYEWVKGQGHFITHEAEKKAANA